MEIHEPCNKMSFHINNYQKRTKTIMIPHTSELECCRTQLKVDKDIQIFFETIRQEVLRLEAIIEDKSINTDSNHDIKNRVEYYESYQIDGSLENRYIIFPDNVKYQINCPFEFANGYAIIPLTERLISFQQQLDATSGLKEDIFKAIIDEVETLRNELNQDYTKFQLTYEKYKMVKYCYYIHQITGTETIEIIYPRDNGFGKLYTHHWSKYVQINKDDTT